MIEINSKSPKVKGGSIQRQYDDGLISYRSFVELKM